MHTSALLLLVPAFLQATTLAAPTPMFKRATDNEILAQKHVNLFSTLKLFGNSQSCIELGYQVDQQACVEGRPAKCNVDGEWAVARSCGQDNETLQCFPVPTEQGVNLECITPQEFESRLDSRGELANVQSFPTPAERVTEITGLGRNVCDDLNQDGETPVQCLVDDDQGEDQGDNTNSPPAAAPPIITTSLGGPDGFNPSPTATDAPATATESPSAAPSACIPIEEDPEDDDELVEGPTPTEVPENIVAPPPANGVPEVVTVTVIISDNQTSTVLPTLTVTETSIASDVPVSTSTSEESTVTPPPTSTESFSPPLTTAPVDVEDPEAILAPAPSNGAPSTGAPSGGVPDVGSGPVTFISNGTAPTTTSAPTSTPAPTAPGANVPDVKPSGISFIPVDNSEVIQDGYYY